MKSKSSGTRSATLIVKCKHYIMWELYHLSIYLSLPADKQDDQQQPNRAGKPSPPTDRDTDPEANDAGGSGNRKELPGVPAGASGAAAKERSGRSEWGACY